MNRRKNHLIFALTALCTCLADASESSSVIEIGSDFDCLIEPKLTVSVGSPTRGVINTLEVDRSQSVEKGQAIALLDAAVEQAAVEEAEYRAAMNSAVDARKAELNLARVNMQRLQELSKKNMAAHQEIDEARAKLLVARTNLQEAHDRKRLAELDLQRTKEVLKQRTILSPISGVVSQVLAFPGEYVEENPIITVAQIDPLRVEVILPVQMFGKVHTGFKAQVMPEAPLSGTYEATVTAVDQVIDAASGTFGVRLELSNEDHRLPGGLKCGVRFVEGGEPAITAESVLPNGLSHGPPKLQKTVASVQKDTSSLLEQPSSADPKEPSKITGTRYETPAAKRSEAIDRRTPAVPVAAVHEPENMQATAPPVVSKQSEHARLPNVSIDDTPRLSGELHRCVAVGPFKSLEQATRFETKLRPLSLNVRHREVQSAAVSEYLVLATDQNSPEANRALLRRLADAGLKDYALFRRGSYKDRVSLGLYTQISTAQRRMDNLAKRGFKTEIVTRTKSAPSHWLAAELRPDSKGRSALFRRIVEKARPLSVEPRDCTRLARK